MAFWKFLGQGLNQSEIKNLGSLEKLLKRNFPDENEEKLAEVACISGLLARVAYVDLNIELSEKEKIQKSVEKWLDMDKENAQKITEITCNETENLAGTENHRYTTYLKDSYSEQKKYQVLIQENMNS